MDITHWTRRDFVARSTLATLGAVGGASLPLNAQQTFEELAVAYNELVGQPLSELPTPALMIDLDIFEKNLATMRDVCKARGHLLRPHGKAHKSSIIAKRQMEYGALGQCAAKLGEAEVLVHGGIRDVLITTAVVGRRKIERLVSLAAIAPDIKVVADSAQNLSDLSAAAMAQGLKLKVVVEVNVGQNRTGVDTTDEAVALVRHISKEKGLEFAGIQGYGGNNQHINGFENRRALAMLANARAVAARRAVEKAGFPVGILTVGGTGTYEIDTEVPEVTEIQTRLVYFHGYELFVDRQPRRREFNDFGNSLSVLTTVVSPSGERPSDHRCRQQGAFH